MPRIYKSMYSAYTPEEARTRKHFAAWATRLKNRAITKNVPFDLDGEYLRSIMTSFCPVFNVPFDPIRSGSPWIPTVDRIIPDKGYVKGNVRIISRKANTIKSDGTLEEILQVAEYVRSVTEPMYLGSFDL